jgi:tetratricopeptide (TPR) repeat protein
MNNSAAQFAGGLLVLVSLSAGFLTGRLTLPSQPVTVGAAPDSAPANGAESKSPPESAPGLNPRIVQVGGPNIPGSLPIITPNPEPRSDTERRAVVDREIAGLRERIAVQDRPGATIVMKFRIAELLISSGRSEQAIAELEGIRTDPESRPGDWNTAQSRQISLWRQTGDAEARLAELQAQQDKLGARDLQLLSGLLAAMDRTEQRLAVLERISQNGPHSQTNAQLLSALIKSNRLDQAAGILERMRAAEDPSFVHHAHILARKYAQAGQKERVQTLALQIEKLARPPSSARNWSIASRIHALAGDETRALHALDRWAAEDATAHSQERLPLRKIEVLLQLRRLDKAAALLGKTEKDLKLKTNIGMAKMLRRDLNAARGKNRTQPR